ncbi:MAG: hypothetical protein R3E04_04035 [Sphingobium sp.]
MPPDINGHSENALGQQACRSGDWKYLSILGNSFLFNVVDDPLERSNMKDRKPDIYQDLVSKYNAWASEMLPLDLAATTGGFTGADIADQFGVSRHRIVPAEDALIAPARD